MTAGSFTGWMQGLYGPDIPLYCHTRLVIIGAVSTLIHEDNRMPVFFTIFRVILMQAVVHQGRTSG